jgi:hypothetical protein
MPTITLTRDEALDILNNGSDIIRDKIVGKGRWTLHHELIFKKNDKFYRTDYTNGATEYQDEFPWQYEDTVICQEVKPYEKTIISYRPTK